MLADDWHRLASSPARDRLLVPWPSGRDRRAGSLVPWSASPTTASTSSARAGRRTAARSSSRGTSATARRSGSIVLDVEDPSARPRRLTDRKAPEYDGVLLARRHDACCSRRSRSRGRRGTSTSPSVNADGTGLKTIVGDGGKLAHQDWPAWSPDGRRFAFSSTHEGNQEIYTAAADGTDLVRLTQSPGLDAHPCWSPDGKTIAFATDRWGGLELAAVRPDGTGLCRLTQSRGLDDYPAYSPDGSRLAFVSNRDGQFEIYVAAADGTGPVNLSRHPLPRHLPDLDARRPRRHLRLGPRRRSGSLHAGRLAVSPTLPDLGLSLRRE